MPGVAAMPGRHARTSVLRTSRMLVACTGRNMMTATVDIAAWLVSQHGAEKRLTNLSLNRLCFFAQESPSDPPVRRCSTTRSWQGDAARCARPSTIPMSVTAAHPSWRPSWRPPTCPTARRWSWTCCGKATAGCRPTTLSGSHAGTAGLGRRSGRKARTPRLCRA